MAERDSRAVFWIAGALAAVLGALYLAREVESPFEPEPRTAFVALLAEGERVAADGGHRLASQRPFRLFAVLEAVDWRGRTVYFTEAPALSLGGREIESAAIRPWSGGRRARVRWFTLDAFAPFLEVGSAADLGRFHLVETFRPEWGEGWSIETVVDPRSVPIDSALALRPLSFGAERYAVRVELYDGTRALTPALRAKSPGADAAGAGDPGVTSATASLPAPLERLSRAFGRTEIGLSTEPTREVAAGIAALERRELAFVEARLLAEHLAAAGAVAAELDWREIDLGRQRLAWGRDLGAGDLVQAGARVAVLFRDQGEIGRLDPADLAIDLFKGLTILRLDQIFRAEDGLALEAARVSVAGTKSAAPRSARSGV